MHAEQKANLVWVGGLRVRVETAGSEGAEMGECIPCHRIHRIHRIHQELAASEQEEG